MKKNIIVPVASDESKDVKIIDDIFQVLCFDLAFDPGSLTFEFTLTFDTGSVIHELSSWFFGPCPYILDIRSWTFYV
jgi:hypothetical protein